MLAIHPKTTGESQIKSLTIQKKLSRSLTVCESAVNTYSVITK